MKTQVYRRCGERTSCPNGTAESARRLRANFLSNPKVSANIPYTNSFHGMCASCAHSDQQWTVPLSIQSAAERIIESICWTQWTHPERRTVIPADTGAGTIVAGDIVTFAGDTGTYGVVSALAAGSFTIYPGPGVNVADNAAITVLAAGSSFVANLVFQRDAFAFANRPLVASSQEMALGSQIVPTSGSCPLSTTTQCDRVPRGTSCRPTAETLRCIAPKPARLAVLRGVV